MNIKMYFFMTVVFKLNECVYFFKCLLMIMKFWYIHVHDHFKHLLCILMNRHVCLTISILTKLLIILDPIWESLQIEAFYPKNRVRYSIYMPIKSASKRSLYWMEEIFITQHLSKVQDFWFNSRSIPSTEVN